MKNVWKLNIDDYMEICERAIKKGLKPGESMEEILLEYAEEKGLKSCGATELNRDELMKEYASHGENILSMEVDEGGQQKFKFLKGEK